MPIICLGPVCLPVWHIGVVLLCLLKPIYNFFLSLCGKKKTLEEPNSQIKNDACACDGIELADQSSNLRLRTNRHTVEDMDETMKVLQSGEVYELKSSQTFYDILQSQGNRNQKPLVVMFSSTSCDPCRKMMEPFQSAAKEFDAFFLKADCSICVELATSSSVTLLPTFCVCDGASESVKVIEKMCGFNPEGFADMISRTCKRK